MMKVLDYSQIRIMIGVVEYLSERTKTYFSAAVGNLRQYMTN